MNDVERNRRRIEEGVAAKLAERAKRKREAADIHAELSHGEYAVACVGLKGWGRDQAIGDGITSALYALVTRCRTREAAEKIAAALNADQPTLRPGGPDVFVYEVVRYRRRDYIPRQQRDTIGERDCDRRICRLS